MTTNYTTLTKDWALDVLCDRIEKKWPGVDIAKERSVLAKKSRASLLHSVGAQMYGDITQIDAGLCDYAFGEMTEAEQRSIHTAG